MSFRGFISSFSLTALCIAPVCTFPPLCLAAHSEELHSKPNPFSAGIEAADPRKMYDKSIAKASGRFVLIRGWDDEKKKEPKEAVPPIQIAPAPNSAPPEVQSEEAQKATDRESIIALYGDPSGPTPIEAEDNAPEPFKAMHMAAEIGDEELAFQYARQYVRRMGKLRSRMDLIMGLQAKALEAEGMADGEGWTSADEYKKYDKYVQAALDERAKEELEEKSKTRDPFLAALPTKYREMSEKLSLEATDEELQLESFHREAIQKYLKPVTPVSTDGVVNVTLVVDISDDRTSLLYARELVSLARESKSMRGVQFELLSPEEVHPDLKKKFQMRTGLYSTSFRVPNPEDSETRAPELRIEIPSKKQHYVIRGVRRGFFVEELVKLMHGEEA